MGRHRTQTVQSYKERRGGCEREREGKIKRETEREIKRERGQDQNCLIYGGQARLQKVWIMQSANTGPSTHTVTHTDTQSHTHSQHTHTQRTS